MLRVLDNIKTFGARELNLDASHLALSVVRIAFHICVLAELVQIYTMRLVSFDMRASWVGDVILPLDILFVTALILGFKTRLSAIAHYVLFVWLIALHVLDVYHFDYVVANFAFLFLFAPSPKCLSIDSKLKNINQPDLNIPAWFFVAFTAAIWQYYFDSVIFKSQSVLWTQGMISYFASLPHKTILSMPEVFEIDWLVRCMSYLSFTVEIIFPLIIFKRLRLLICLLAIALHLGIVLVCPLPWFGLGMMAVLLMFLNWQKILSFRWNAVAPATPSMRERSPAILWTLPAVLFAIQIVLIFIQVPQVITHTTGLRRHDLYTDGHFLSPYPILRFVAHDGPRTFEIPTFNPTNSHVIFPYSTGRYYVSTCIVLRGTYANDAKIIRFVSGWMRKANMNPQRVEIFCKNTLVPFELDFDHDNRIRQEPWKLAGHIDLQGSEAPGNGKIVWDRWYETRYPKGFGTLPPHFKRRELALTGTVSKQTNY